MRRLQKVLAGTLVASDTEDTYKVPLCVVDGVVPSHIFLEVDNDALSGGSAATSYSVYPFVMGVLGDDETAAAERTAMRLIACGTSGDGTDSVVVATLATYAAKKAFFKLHHDRYSPMIPGEALVLKIAKTAGDVYTAGSIRLWVHLYSDGL